MTIKHVHPQDRKIRFGGKVRSATIRKSGRDGPSLSPTERTRKNKLMRQFQALESGTQASSPQFIEGFALIEAERKRRIGAGLCPACGGPGVDGAPAGHEAGCPQDGSPKGYRVTTGKKRQPILLMHPSEIPPDPWNPEGAK